jgi:hypothetical protein
MVFSYKYCFKMACFLLAAASIVCCAAAMMVSWAAIF